MNEIVELEHDIEGLKEILSLPLDILEALNRESEGSKPNIKEIEEECSALRQVSPSHLGREVGYR